MSAVPVDEFSFDDYARPVVQATGKARSFGNCGAVAVARRQAPADRGVPIVSPASSLQLTDRGIAVLLVVFAAAFLIGLATLVGGFLAVSGAPLTSVPAAASGVAATLNG